MCEGSPAIHTASWTNATLHPTPHNHKCACHPHGSTILHNSDPPLGESAHCTMRCAKGRLSSTQQAGRTQPRTQHPTITNELATPMANTIPHNMASPLRNTHISHCDVRGVTWQPSSCARSPNSITQRWLCIMMVEHDGPDPKHHLQTPGFPEARPSVHPTFRNNEHGPGLPTSSCLY